MTPFQRDIARHALGLPNQTGVSFRNRYYAAKNSPQKRAWDDLVSHGLAERGGQSQLLVGYFLTSTGAHMALLSGERLDPEDFPEATPCP